MNEDIRIKASFPSHRKTRKLARALGDHGVASLVRLWIYASQHHIDGVLAMKTDDIELAAQFAGEPGSFVAALRDAGFLDKIGRAFALHDWKDHQPFVVDQPYRQERNRENAHKRHHRVVKRPERCDFCRRDVEGVAYDSDATRMRPLSEVDAPSPSPSLSTVTDTKESSAGGSGRRSGPARAESDDDRNGWRPPFNSQRMFQFKVDEIRKWSEKVIKRDGCGPGEDEFESAFKAKFGMTWRYWQELAERCEAHYSRPLEKAANA